MKPFGIAGAVGFWTLVGLSTLSRPADACAPPRCLWGSFLPPDGEPESSAVPANFGGVLWRPRSSWSPPTVTAGSTALFDLSSEPAIPVSVRLEPQSTGGWLVKPAQPLKPGTDYRLLGADFCDGTGLADQTAEAREFRVAPAAALPVELGVLRLGTATRGELWVKTVSGSCSETISAASVLVSVDLAPGALPWRDLFVFRTLVDGQPWHAQGSIKQQLVAGGSWQGRGVDLLFARCATPDPGTDSGLEEGRHAVRIVAELPGLGVSLNTAEASFELRCSPGAEPPDAGSPGPEPRPVPDPAPASGCGHAGAWAGTGLGLVALPAMFLRRSRRRRPVQGPP